MVYVDIENCSHNQYNDLINYILKICNNIYFHFPNFKNNSDYWKINYDNNGNINQDSVLYLRKNQKLLDLCYKMGAKKYVSYEYLTTRLAYKTQIINVELFPYLEQLIRKHHIFQWQYNVLPEDLCFFKNDKCRFFSIAHEHQFMIFNETKDDISFLSNGKFEYLIKK